MINVTPMTVNLKKSNRAVSKTTYDLVLLVEAELGMRDVLSGMSYSVFIYIFPKF
jgi:hypothetical protein